MDRWFGSSIIAQRALKIAFTLGAGAMLVVGCGPTYPNCDTDEQCHEGEFCVNGHCEDCRDDGQCPTGQMCESNDCVPIPGWCNSDADCPSSQECVSNHCQDRPPVVETVIPEAVPQVYQLQPAYFPFNESTLDDAARSALTATQACMGERSITAIRITGMADPRGTEEYNRALGTHRATAARDHLQRLGVGRRAMTTRSVGEEMATGSDEYAWSRDRRADVEAQ